MPLAQYRKAPVRLLAPSPRPPLPAATSPWRRLLAPTLVTLGSLMITTAIWPIIQYQFIFASSLKPVRFLSPIPESELAKPQVYQSKFLNPQGQVAGLAAQGSDDAYTDPRTWFPEADFSSVKRPLTPQTITEYSLAIPEVNITAAKVIIGGEDLNKGLIHYPGTALPGQAGSTVIFGHSVLRQFYNPSVKNPNRYMSIFSKIMTLDIGQPIYLDYGQTRYTYVVADKVQVEPEDVFILEQRYNGSDLKLITCVPEGTYLRRGVVIANLTSSTPLTP